LQAQDGRDLLVAQDAEGIAEHILSLIQDPNYSHTLGQAGRRYVEEHHHWDTIVGQLEGIYHEVIHQPQGKSPKKSNP
jgi:glycosyltransferase involved in cell wall biosynthesis